MKHIYASLDIQALADAMLSHIRAQWKNPFVSPAVLFADAKMEQWFKLHWLQSSANATILMNLKTVRLEQLLFDLIVPPEEANSVRRLPSELLRDCIITQLTTKTASGAYYFTTLDCPDVTQYLSDGAGGIQYIRLYDFAQEMAALFLEYEATRPQSFDEVVTGWQKKLYDDVLGNGICIDGVEYLTFLQLVARNKCANGGSVQFYYDDERPLFVFAFSGMGQQYRELLKAFAESHELYVYLQTSLQAEHNELARAWLGFGRENLALWGGAAELVPASYGGNTTLQRLQRAIAADASVSSRYAADDSLTLTAAPSAIREVEAVHSKICALLSTGAARLSDILVVAPKLQDYKTAIEQVFDQSDKSDRDFPYIPYTIADYAADGSLAAEAVSVLCSIIEKGFLCRADVFALLRNYLVQTVRGISDTAVSAWAEWVASMNIFRDRDGEDGRINDWETAKRRLLLVRLTNGSIITDDAQYLPFATLESGNDDSLYAFVAAVDDLEALLAYSHKQALSLADVSELQRLLALWLQPPAELPKSLESELFVLQNLETELSRQKKLFALASGVQSLSPVCFSLALIDAAQGTVLRSASIFTQGVTFADFRSNRILPAPYVFIMGLDSKAFPGVDTENVLDIRGKKMPGDDSIPERNKNAFLCQLMTAKKGLFISYINKNLQKDEDFYQSSVLTALCRLVAIDECIITIDEKRPWSALYTRREFRNKHNFQQLEASSGLASPEAAPATLEPAEETAPARVRISDFKRFLEEPFKFMAEQLFSRDKEDSEAEKLAFEPLLFDALTQSTLLKAYIKARLSQPQAPFDRATFAQQLQNENLLPDSYFGELALEGVITQGDALREKIAAITECADGALSFDAKANLLLTQNVGGVQKDWHLTGGLAWHNSDFAQSAQLATIEINGSKNCLHGYLTALTLLAALPPEDERRFTVSLHVCHADSKRCAVQAFELQRSTARALLQALYAAVYLERFSQCVPREFLEKAEPPSDFDAFKSSLQSSFGAAPWNYFPKAVLFDLDTDLGYSEAHFVEEWERAAAHQRALLCYLPDSPEGEY